MKQSKVSEEDRVYREVELSICQFEAVRCSVASGATNFITKPYCIITYYKAKAQST
jgi:hypothetical protein